MDMELKDKNQEKVTLLEIFLNAGYSISVAEEDTVFSRFMQVVSDVGFDLINAESDDISEFISNNEDSIFPATVIEDFVDVDEY